MALSVISNAQAAAATVNLPTFSAGDVAIVFAYRSGSTTPPTVPGTFTTITNSSGANTNSRAIGYRVLQAGDTTTGTWTNATAICVIVLRGQAATPNGANASGGTNTSTLTTPALTLNVTDGSSCVVAFAGSKSTNANTVTLSSTTDDGSTIGAINLAHELGATSWSSRGYSTTVNASGNRMDAVEILALTNPNVNVSDSVTTVESLGIVGPIIYDPINTSESVTVQITGGSTALTVNVSDSTSTTETIGRLLVSFVNVSDSSTLSESLGIIGAPIVYEPIHTSESVTVQVVGGSSTLSVNVSDSTSTSESVALNLPGYTYAVNVSDSATTAESKTVNPPNSVPQVSVSDSTTTSEWVVVAFDPPITFTLEVNVSDSVTTTESKTVSMPSLVVSSSDSVATVETVGRLLASFVNISDSSSTTDTASVSFSSLSSLSVNVSDSVSTTDTPTVTPLAIGVNRSEAVTTSDTPTVAPLLIGGVNVSESVSSTDTPTVAPLLLGVNAADSTSVSESVAVSRQTAGAFSVSVSDHATLTENVTSAIPAALKAAVSDATTVIESYAVSFGFVPNIDLPTTFRIKASPGTLALKSDPATIKLRADTVTGTINAAKTTFTIRPDATTLDIKPDEISTAIDGDTT